MYIVNIKRIEQAAGLFEPVRPGMTQHERVKWHRSRKKLRLKKRARKDNRRWRRWSDGSSEPLTNQQRVEP
jgi:hypothetical protein